LRDPIWKEIEEKYCKKCDLHKKVKNEREFYECARCALRLYIKEKFKGNTDYIY